ncbi:MAG: hypothetical protein NC340_04040 [Ruminococcus flavefaciens]|nr:hypothetical protein [Ruminococcus flavefaciens]MCM1229222.1 hypothetical protein [Ruminococcus flavefaciens]
MSYIGENKYFSFRDGFCESTVPVSSREATELGRTIAPFFTRFSAGASAFERLPLLYALCCGISECGKDVYVCENTDMPSFRFSSPLLSSDCGIFISGNHEIRLSFFDKSGFAMPEAILGQIMRAEPSEPSEHSGKIRSVTSFRSIYINNIADSLGKNREKIPAGISCGNRNVRSLWLEFFTGESDELVFQISDDGQRVNAYSSAVGFVSYEKLMLAYCLDVTENGGVVWIPDNLHYMADGISPKIKRFGTETGLPENAVNTRFLRDSLYMCVHIAEKLDGIVQKLPEIASAKREIALDSAEKFTAGQTVSDGKGRVIITRSGRNRISLLAQTLSAETASELCAVWTEKFRRHNL